MLRSIASRLILRSSGSLIRNPTRKIQQVRLFTRSRPARAKSASVDEDLQPTTLNAIPKFSSFEKFSIQQQILLPMLTEKDKQSKEKPPSVLWFSYIPTDQEENIANLVKSILEADTAAQQTDKKAINGAVFNGMAGSGKSRMTVELMGLMRDAARMSALPKAKDLATWLAKPKEIIIDWHNGLAYSNGDETNWTPSLILGSRVAAKYWFKDYKFAAVRDAINNMSAAQQKKFHFREVVEAIEEENNSRPLDQRYSMLYIANDEFQYLKSIKTPHNSSGNSQDVESLSRAIVREFYMVSRNRLGEFFIFGSFVGIGFTQDDLFETPSFGSFPDYCIRRLSVKSMLEIVKKEEEEACHFLLQIQELPRLLATFGGNPRVLEVFLKKVAPAFTEENYDTATVFGEVQKGILERYGKKFAQGGPLQWPTYLSLAGYTIDTRDAIVTTTMKTQTNNNPLFIEWSAGDIEKTGCISLRGPTLNEGWTKNLPTKDFTSPLTMVFDVPLIMAKMVIAEFAQPMYAQGQKLLPTADAYSFEELALGQLVLRWNIFNLASESFVSAKQLFRGGYFTTKFQKRAFALEDDLLSVTAAKLKGKWASSPSAATDFVETQQGRVDFTSKSHRCIHFGGNNVFDGHIRLFEYESRAPVILWLDTKHSSQKGGDGSLSPKEVRSLRTKLEKLSNALPKYEHLLVVISNRHYKHKDEYIDDKMCIIARDGLSFGTSPWFSLLSQVDIEATKAKPKAAKPKAAKPKAAKPKAKAE